MNEKRKGLCEVSIGNFKAFAETQHIPIRPLTLIYGANSSGKSSIIHSLLLLSHAFENGNLDVHHPKAGGESVDLGGFAQYLHNHDLKRNLEIGWEFSIGGVLPETSDSWGGFSQMDFRFEIGIAEAIKNKTPSTPPPQVVAFELWVDSAQFIRLERQNDDRLFCTVLNPNHPQLEASIVRRIDEIAKKPDYSAMLMDSEDASEEEKEEKKRKRLRQQMANKQKLLQRKDEFKQAYAADLAKVPFSKERFFPTPLPPEDEENSYAYSNPGFDLGMIEDSFCLEQEPELSARIFRYKIEHFFKNFHSFFKTWWSWLHYLGPLRFYPPRHVTGMHDQDPNWFSGGGQAWERLKHDPETLQKVNDWLTGPNRMAKDYKLVVRELVDLRQLAPELKARLEDCVGKLMADPKASISDQVDSAIRAAAQHQAGVLSEIVLQDHTGTEVSHRDVGQGISQVLPLLVHGYGDENKIIAVEQPELHLHPALQAELADVFIESALGDRKNTFLLESHSEHLLLRIMRRIRETKAGTLPPGKQPVYPSDVSILYVEPVGGRSIVREMPLNERGELIKDWPGGFFEEGLREMLM